jgi:predicted TPR repeat methyltransferase
MRSEEAIAAYRRALESGGDAGEIEFALAALGADTSPVVAPKQHVTNLFDKYADTFDQHLVSGLKYQTPALLFDAIARFSPPANMEILDLGCGTGLFGPQMRPLARTLTGIDLSSNMLKKAEQRQLYDHLICGDIAEFLATQRDAFDLVVAADVFVYIGDLSKVFSGVRGALREGGLFGFSVEATDEADFVLRTTLRYAHSVAYLEKLARDHRFALESVEARVIRQENEVDVNGYLAVMRCA